MKFKSFTICIAAFFLSGVLLNTPARADDNTVIPSTGEYTTIDVLLFCTAIAILLVLVLWLYKGSVILNDTVNINEPQGRDWIKKNLNDLGANQLETLIKRGNSLRQGEDNDMLDHKN